LNWSKPIWACAGATGAIPQRFAERNIHPLPVRTFPEGKLFRAQ
jgi:hypothetical protein